MTLEQQVRRWKLLALVTVALLLGYIVGQVAPRASAQTTTKVQLDLSNCRTQSLTQTARLDTPSGSIIAAVEVNPRELGDTTRTYYITTCR